MFNGSIRTFKICDYGVCDLEDLLLEISETSVVLTTIDDELMVAIPKREQTLDEVERTHQFAQECVELLRHAPDCRLPFNKFIPSYHHHFGRQCRKGFSKVRVLGQSSWNVTIKIKMIVEVMRTNPKL